MFTDLLVVSAVAALVLLPTLGQTQYLADREMRHAEISREMTETHDYIVPHLLGKVYPNKPPVMHAAAAVLMEWWGRPSVFLARLPSALAALGVASMTYGLGRVLADRRLGLVGALGLLAIPGFVIMAQQARPDMILCFAIVASTLGLALGMKECRRGLRGLWFVVAGMAAGLGVVTKGPYGLLFPLFFAVLWPIRRPEWRRPQLGWVGFVTACLAVAAVWGWRRLGATADIICVTWCFKATSTSPSAQVPGTVSLRQPFSFPSRWVCFCRWPYVTCAGTVTPRPWRVPRQFSWWCKPYPRSAHTIWCRCIHSWRWGWP